MSRKRIETNIAYDDKKRVYYAYFDCGTDGAGQRLRKTQTFPGLQQARRALHQFHRQREEGDPTCPAHVTVEGWLSYWLEEIVLVNRAYTTYYCYKNIICRHLVPALGQIRLRELRPMQIQRYYTAQMREQGLSPNTVHKHHVLLHTALRVAFQQGVLEENPVERVEAPRQRPPRQVYYTPEQLRTLLAEVEDTPLEMIVKLAGYLGLRRGEICGLKWEHVRMEEGVLVVEQVRTTAGCQVITKEPKTDSSVRTLAIAGLEDLCAALGKTRAQQTARARQSDYQDSGYVVTYRDGRPWHPNQVTKEVADFVEKRGLPHITVHGLRHTFASVANKAKLPLLDIGKALGHKNSAITGRVYTHLFDQTHHEVLSTVSHFLQAVAGG